MERRSRGTGQVDRVACSRCGALVELTPAAMRTTPDGVELRCESCSAARPVRRSDLDRGSVGMSFHVGEGSAGVERVSGRRVGELKVGVGGAGRGREPVPQLAGGLPLVHPGTTATVTVMAPRVPDGVTAAVEAAPAVPRPTVALAAAPALTALRRATGDLRKRAAVGRERLRSLAAPAVAAPSPGAAAPRPAGENVAQLRVVTDSRGGGSTPSTTAARRGDARVAATATVAAQSGPGPGWYPNPDGSGDLRYFDGAQWTGRVRASVAPVPPPPTPGPPPASGPPPGSGPPPPGHAAPLWRLAASLAVGLLIGLIIGLAVGGSNTHTGPPTTEPSHATTSVPSAAENSTPSGPPTEPLPTAANGPTLVLTP